MSVVGLHPEQLIDKLETGALSDAENAQLSAPGRLRRVSDGARDAR